MGCWNGTCGISQLPILTGQKVKAFLLLQSEYAKNIRGSGVCYPTEYFRPWFFPVTAEYNDYGSIENIQTDWNSEYMLETFRKWLADGTVRILGHDEAEVNDPGIEKFEKLDDVFDCVERGALVFKSIGEKLNAERTEMIPSEVELKIGIFMVVEDVFDGIVAESIRFMSLKENEYYYIRDAKAREKALDAINKIRQSKTATDEFTTSMCDMYADRFLGEGIEEHYAFKHYKTILYVPNKITVTEFMAKTDEVRHIGTAMAYLRKLWIPQAGQGSQSEELSFNKALIAAMTDHINAREAEIAFQLWNEEAEDKKFEAVQSAKKNAKKKIK